MKGSCLALGAALACALVFSANAQTTDPGDGADPGDGTVLVTTAAAPTRQIYSDRWYNLTVQRGQEPSYQFYDGNVEIATRTPEGGPTATKVYVTAIGLPLNNPYTVSVTRKSDGTSVVLGKMRVHAVSKAEFNRYLTADIPETYRAGVEIYSLGKVVFGGGNRKRMLPEGFDGADVATVALTDAQGVPRLSGRPRSAGFYIRTRRVTLPLAGDPASAPRATAVATAERRVVRGVAELSFQLSAQRLPGSTVVTILADGVSVGQFTTGPNGRLLVSQGRFPAERNRAGKVIPPQKLVTDRDLSKTRQVTLTDAQGNVLASSGTEESQK